MPSTAPYVPLVRLQPQGLYTYFCKELALHPNSGVLERLSQVCLLCGPPSGDTPLSKSAAITPPDAPPMSRGISKRDDDDAPAATLEGALLHSSKGDAEESTDVQEMSLGSSVSASGGCIGSSDTSLDLTANFVGREGLRPLLQTIRVVHFFTKIDLSGHAMDSDTVAEMVKYLDGVHSLRCLGLNSNPRITQAGGRYLKLFAATNVNVDEILLDGTSITVALRNIVYGLCAANRKLRENPSLYEDKVVWQHRRRHSVGIGSSPQPTPMKRDAFASVSPSRGAHGDSVSQLNSASRASSIAVAASSAAAPLNEQRQASSQTIGTHHHHAATSIILPPFYAAPFLPALLAVGALKGGRVTEAADADPHALSSPHTPLRPTCNSSDSVEAAAAQLPAQLDPTSVASRADPLDGPLEAIDYVFASALPNPTETSTTPAQPRRHPPPAGMHEEFPALQLLRDAMYDLC